MSLWGWYEWMKKQLLDDVIFHEERLETFSKPEIIQKTRSPPSVSLGAPVTAFNRPEPDEIEVLATLSLRVIFQVKIRNRQSALFCYCKMLIGVTVLATRGMFQTCTDNTSSRN
jgi:hypothetical protein